MKKLLLIGLVLIGSMSFSIASSESSDAPTEQAIQCNHLIQDTLFVADYLIVTHGEKDFDYSSTLSVDLIVGYFGVNTTFSGISSCNSVYLAVAQRNKGPDGTNKGTKEIPGKLPDIC